ncbi:hypothetical protein BH09ACT6_BH09ACT6_05990 [soil metagenome]
MHTNARRPRLTPATADVRRAVRELLARVLPAAPGTAARRTVDTAPDARPPGPATTLSAPFVAPDARPAGIETTLSAPSLVPEAQSAGTDAMPPAAHAAPDVSAAADARLSAPDAMPSAACGVPDARVTDRDPIRSSPLVVPDAQHAAPDTRSSAHAGASVAQETGLATQPPVPHDAPLILVGLSGGPDSLALAAAVAFEAPRAGLRAGAIVVDHGLQAGSAEVAAAAARQARELGLDPVLVERVTVAGASPGPSARAEDADGSAAAVEARGGATQSARPSQEHGGGAHHRGSSTGVIGATGGPEAAARTARYAAFERAIVATGATHVLLAHTLDDQAETVLLGLARGSGPASLSGMSAVNGVYLRPLLGIRRRVVHQSLVDQGLEAWNDPQNLDPAYARVRVRETVLPLLEHELGPGIADALARTADQLHEDSEALDALAAEWAAEIVEHADAGIAVDVHGLASNPAALAQRIVRFVVAGEFGTSLSRAQTLAVLKLVTEWHGQVGVDLPGIRVVRVGTRLVFARAGTER